MAEDFNLPDLGENVAAATVGNILVKVGDVIANGQVIIELETEKAVFELPSGVSGQITALHIKSGDAVKTGQKILSVEPSGTPAKPADAPKAPPAPAPTPAAAAAPATTPTPAKSPAAAQAVPNAPMALSTRGGHAAIPAGPYTRRLARQMGVDLRRLTGTGLGGRITREDLATFANRLNGQAGAGVVVPDLPDFSAFGESERVSLSKLAQTAANHLAMCWQTIPHVTQLEVADITDLEEARRAFSKQSAGPKVTMTVLAIKAVVAALKAFPRFNASYDAKTNEVVIKKFYNIGIAVDTEYGLLVPVVKNADQKSISELATEVQGLAEKARGRKLDLADMKGGTFTISNLGGIGGSGFTPIVNFPEVAILGLSKATYQPIYRDGADLPEKRLMMPMSLSYDHRVINGADGARFVVKLAQLFTDPFRLLVEV